MQGPARFVTLDELERRTGLEIGCTAWRTIDQPKIDAFGAVTGDQHPMHVDPAAAAGTPFGGTISHGLLTLSLVADMSYEVCPGVLGPGSTVNYGFDRVRFVSPVPVGSRVRGRFVLHGVERGPGARWNARYDVTIEIEGRAAPAVVAHWMIAGSEADTAPVAPQPRPFRLQVPAADLEDLQRRLDHVRWPDEDGTPAWTTGTPLPFARRLVAHWRHRFDWRVQEAALNALAQFKVKLGDIDLHYIHERGDGPAPLPLLLSHGWPGSVFEFVKIIPMLTHPARFGADAADAFTVVAPSLPGYGLSFTPGQPRLDLAAIGDLFVRLMTEVLGYGRFAAQGGDWGAFVTTAMAHRHPQHLTGIHLNLLPLRRDAQAREAPTEDDTRYLREARRWGSEGAGYQAIQGTRPQTLAYGLTDSPVGLAAWIAEKFAEWTDCGDGPARDPERAITLDEMLADISLYWFTGAIGSSFWPYYAQRHGGASLPTGATVGVPTGVAVFPREILTPPRALAERTYTDLRRWTVMPAGGHFAALEQPEALAREIRAFFKPLRA